MRQKRGQSGIALRRTCSIPAAALGAAALFAVLPSASQAAVPAPGNWAIAFDDEFNGNSLDTMKWNYNYPWSQHGLADDSVEQASQVTVGAGVMTLTAIQSGQWYGGNYYNYTSGAVNTNGKLNFTYGYIEASQKMAGNQGAWPAFWTLQNGWPPEIDIQEDPEFNWNESSYPLTYHFSYNGGAAQSVGTTVNTGINLAGSYNNYGVDWEPTSLTFYFNGSEVYSVSSSQANIAQMAQEYLLIDLGVGGWPGEPPAGTYYPATMETDWVRVWQHPSNTNNQVNWINSSNDSWDDAAAWSGGVANQSNDLAWFGVLNASTTNEVINWTGSRTVRGLTFQSNSNYTLGSSANGGAGLMFAPLDGVPTAAETVNIITNNGSGAGAATINARVEVPFSLLTLQVDNANPTPTTFAGDIIGTGNLTFNSGSSVISGNDQLTGTTVIAGGATLIVTGQISASGIVKIASGTMIVNGGSVTSTSWMSVGSNAAQTGKLNLSGGSVTAASDFNIGDVSSASGLLNMTSGYLTVANFYLGKSGTATGLMVQSGGTVSGTGGNDWRIGGGASTADASATGTLNLSGGAIFSAPANFQVGAYGHGTVNQTAGVVNVGSYLSIGRFAGGVGIYNMAGGSGTLNAKVAPLLIVGEQGNGTLLVGGTSTVNALTLSIGYNGGVGQVNQSGGTVFASAGVQMGNASGGSGVYSLAGGTLYTSGINRGAGAGTFNFAGGTLVTTAASTSLLSNLSALNLLGGGGTINTNGFAEGITSAFGGLHLGPFNKTGLGTLTLSGTINPTLLSVTGGALNQSGGTINASSGLSLGSASNGTGSFALQGGTLITPAITSPGGTSTFYFAGGTLQPSASTSTFISGLTAIDIKAGGALINTAGDNVTITQPLLHDPATTGTDGGLTKSGAGTLVLAGIDTFTGPTVVSAGTLTFAAGPGTAGVRTQNSSGGISVSSGAVLTVAMAAASTSRTVLITPSVNLAGASGAWSGAVDLADNDLDVTNGGSSSLATIDNQILQGKTRNTGIYSSAVNADTTALTTLGAILNGTTYGTGTALGTFDGINPGPTDVLVKYTYYGDANLDGQVDGSDYTLIDNGFNNGLTGWQNGDFNDDGVIDGSDYTLIDNAFNTQGGSLSAAAITAVSSASAAPTGETAVPEPAMLMLTAAGAIASTLRRRRCHPRAART